ncbi:unnamed protein product [Ectocarpus sp. 12 AP-2014]
MLHEELDDGTDIDRGQFQTDLDRIVTSGRQLLALIDDILDLSKIETGKMKLSLVEFHPGEVLGMAVDALAPVLRRNGNELRCADFSALPVIYNDSVKFRQIVVNLLSNAAKFTNEGVIEVSAALIEEQPRMVEVAVSDSGIGMTEAQQGQIFEAFVQAEDTTSEFYGGSGLGLSICRDFSELMGGSISVESEPGQGSTFRFRLPADRESAPEAA